MKKFIITFLGGIVLFTPMNAAKAAIPVVDMASVAQLIEQVKHTLEVIQQLRALADFEELDHLNLDSQQFGQFIEQYGSTLDALLGEIDGYQGGGLLGQIERLDEVYFSYYDTWEEKSEEIEEAHPKIRALRKQLLWTRIQLKHAAKVAARIRESLPEQKVVLEKLQTENFASVGELQALKVGNQLSGVIASNLETLNTQMGEFLQVESARGLEENTLKGLQHNRLEEALQGWAKEKEHERPAPLNPFGGR